MGKPKRPTFLTILCVLSALMSAWSLWDGLQRLFTDKSQRDLKEQQIRVDRLIEQLGPETAQEPLWVVFTQGSLRQVESIALHNAPYSKAIVAVSIISLVAIWSMWKLRRWGYWAYIIATLCGLLTPLIWMEANVMSIVVVTIGGVLGIAFAILFGLNLKHMH